MNITYEIYDSTRGEFYIRDEENVLDDLFEMIEEAVEKHPRGYPYTQFGLKGYVGDHCNDDTHLGTATGVRLVLAWVCSPHFQADGDTGRYEFLLKRIQEKERKPNWWTVLKEDYPSL